MKEIETERLWLRMFSPADLVDLSLIFADPEVVRYIGTGQPTSRDETERALYSIIRHWERHRFGRWAAALKHTGKLIGYGGLRSFEGTPELVYLLSRPYWGLGLATEMAEASLKFGFEDKGFGHIIAMAKVANLASQRVMNKVGMLFERRDKVFGMEIVRYQVTREHYVASRARFAAGELARAYDAQTASL